MITSEKAMKLVLAKNPGKKIAFGMDYDSEHYVFGLKSDAISMNGGPMFGVNKRTGEVTNFIVHNFGKFMDAMNNSSIPIG